MGQNALPKDIEEGGEEDAILSPRVIAALI
jgi:hypothetical protein